MSKEILEILGRIANEKNITLDECIVFYETAMASAARKVLDGDLNITRAMMDRDSGKCTVLAMKEVVADVFDENLEISLAEARVYGSNIQIGDEVEIDVTPADYGRIAAQAAKQVFSQKIRESQREQVYDAFRGRVGEMVTGTVQRHEKGDIIVDLGNADAVLTAKEQAQGERYRYGETIKALIVDVRQSVKDPQVILSRRSDDFLRALFEQEVPEIADRTVTIKCIAREPGKRSKIAVRSSDADVDAVGSCVGMKGSRVQMIVQELRGERIDIVEYSDDRRRFVANSLKPAEVDSVEMAEDGNRALVIVKDDMLSLAIGKGGLNARLACRLTGVEIDIMSDRQLADSEHKAKSVFTTIEGVDAKLAEELMSAGFFSLNDIVDAGLSGLSEIHSLDEDSAEILLERVALHIERGGGALKADSESVNGSGVEVKTNQEDIA